MPEYLSDSDLVPGSSAWFQAKISGLPNAKARSVEELRDSIYRQRLRELRNPIRRDGPGPVGFDTPEYASPEEEAAAIADYMAPRQFEQQQFDESRTPLRRLASADAFLASAPVRMVTGGKYGLGDLMGVLPQTSVLGALAPSVQSAESDFARANQNVLQELASAGESAMALPGLQELGYVSGGLRGALAGSKLAARLNALAERVLPDASSAGQVNIFAGPKAATADREALRLAQEMEKRGIDRDVIWKETGWGRGADNKWRFEIDDSASALAGLQPIKGTVKTPMGAVYIAPHPNYSRRGIWGGREGRAETFSGIEHPEYYAAYPELIENISGVRAGRAGFPTEGLAKMKKGKAVIHIQGLGDEARSGLLHELQHPVQVREGFTTGGTPAQFYDEPVVDSMAAHLAAQNEAFSKYHRLAGEVEARNVQKRMRMTPEERRSVPPWETEDVPRSKQLLGNK